MPDSTILIGRSDHEWMVRFTYHWAQLIINKAEELGMKAIDLQRENYNRKKLKTAILENDPFFIFGNGHGDSNLLRGYEDKAVLEACENDELLSGRIVYSLACMTGKVLGQSAINKGCSSYIGYGMDFTFIARDPLVDDPLNDDFARGFMEASNQIPLTILDGGTSGQAYQNSQRVFDKWIEYWGNQNMAEASYIVGALLLDKEGQTLLEKS